VIDEMAGILVTFWAIPFNAETAVLGFYIFRILDIANLLRFDIWKNVCPEVPVLF
jgi:phosphatidylglycerophosphatase A